jgi:hypothetical protein
MDIAPADGREVAMTSFSPTSEMRADSIYLFDSGTEVGQIKREEGMWTLGDGVQWVLELIARAIIDQVEFPHQRRRD